MLHDLRQATRSLTRAPGFAIVAATTIALGVAANMAGGRSIRVGPFKGDGRRNPYRSGFVRRFALDAGERAALKASLESLTDSTFLHDERFGNPWPDTSVAVRGVRPGGR